MNNHRKLTRKIMICLLTGVSAFYSASLSYGATSVVSNTQLPDLDGHKTIAGKVTITQNSTTSMTIAQATQTAVNKWTSFDVGGSATVNFTGPQHFNSVNYVNGGNVSQIYGTINANGGNVFLINPAGVQIGKSAQINVGSLYVSNKEFSDNTLNSINDQNITDVIKGNKSYGNGELMSLGNINATNVTFEGNGRIVIDTERLKDTAGQTKMAAENIIVNTSDTNNVILGYDAYNSTSGYDKANPTTENLATVNGSNFTKQQGYMWVEDLEQLQAMNTNLSGNYALRNSIDATSTAEANAHFTSIGDANAFTGKLEGLGNNIFSLTVDNTNTTTGDAGLFAATNGAVISNVNLIGGSIKGSGSVGALVGKATNTTITNVTNTASVTGTGNTPDSATGGIVGTATSTTLNGVINTGTITGTTNVGGLVGVLEDSEIKGTSYNLGAVTGKVTSSGTDSGYNVGGLVGSATKATIGDGTNLVYNRLDVTGVYNVGGIVGSMSNSTVQNAENSGNVAATGYTTETYKFHTSDPTTDGNGDGLGEATVQVANAGGIVGNSKDSSTIKEVQNSGDVTSSKQDSQDKSYYFYNAGNVGGIVGRAENTNISDATNKENDIRGAHNVGGIAGYFGGSYDLNYDPTTDPSYAITNSKNINGDIMATGARNDTKLGQDAWVTETIRRDGSGGSSEAFHIGNMGGIAGYLAGDNTYIRDSSNSGGVHSLEITTAITPTTIKDASKAANTGGIAGKLDRSKTTDLDGIKKDSSKAAISGSYNTGTVRGFTGIGGVVGMMYNGEVTRSYNVGTIKTTRQTNVASSGNYEPANMGGIVGDATELTSASALIYDVYNAGQIGDETYTTYARHVGGIVGRFSGTLQKAYNTGNIYNNATDNGGIIGYWYKGNIQDVFNTGNITINGQIANRVETGGIVGGVYANNYGGGGPQTFILTNAYNLGAIRVMDTNDGSVAGIIGGASQNGTGLDLTIRNVYTTGNIYVGSNTSAEAITTISNNATYNRDITNAYYITPDSDDFNLANNKNWGEEISKDDAYTSSTWEKFIEDSGSDVWRIYDGTTPILNAFMPATKDYIEGTGKYEGQSLYDDNKDNDIITSVQYGTAYDPLLTIITAKSNTGGTIDFDWDKAGITGTAGLVVNGADLNITDMSSNGSTVYSGTIYTNGDLTINTAGKDIILGSASKIYGSSVDIEGKNGNLTSYGTITATGAKEGDQGAVTINVGSLDNYGVISTTDSGTSITVAGIDKQHKDVSYNDITNAYVDLPTVGDQYAITTESHADTTQTDITITGADDVNLHYGNAEKGYVHAAGDLTVTSTNGDVFSDSDLFVGGDLSLTSKGETLLSLTNIGQVQSKLFITDVANAIRGLTLTGSDDTSKINEIKNVLNAAGIFTKYDIEDSDDQQAIGQYILDDIKNNLVIPTDTLQDQSALRYLHQFLGGFNEDNSTHQISLEGNSAKLTINMWDASDQFDLDKYDIKNINGKTEAGFITALNSTNISVNGTDVANNKDITYIEITDAEQLKNIQSYADNPNNNKNILSYNFALMKDVDASKITDYKAIGGSGTAYTGIFDGRDYRIIGLNVDESSNANAGVFGVIGDEGTVENLRVYSSKITGTDTAGAIAGINNGTIQNVTTFGNDVTVLGSDKSTEITIGSGSTTQKVKVGAAGGVAGINTGTVDDVETTGSVVAGDAIDTSRAFSTAGGIVGINQSLPNIDNSGVISNSYSDSAVTASAGSTYGLGGIAGVNAGTLSSVDSLGVTRGLYKYNTGNYKAQSGQVGGLTGINNGTISGGYNESVVNGSYEVGGIAGINNGQPIDNVVNAANVTGDGKDITDGSYIGGLVGNNSGSITNGRNNGEIAGHDYVGGLVGSNAADSTLMDLVNDSSASITGNQYVGGIAGSNDGTITAKEDEYLINRGVISGYQYVGGVAGLNNGEIENTLNSVILKAINSDNPAMSDPSQYFGGVVGLNTGTVKGAANTGNIDITAHGGTYVGGIIGYNTEQGTLQGIIYNEGSVAGKANVGGIIGLNENTNVLQGTADNRLTIINEGNINAGDGGAAGIFYENTGDIQYADIMNSGTVTGGTDTTSITGSLFGKNSGNITYSTLTNSGIVTGGGTVGGLIGQNSGTVTNSSLINTAAAQVSGTTNVGGLIGINSGTIMGGRNDANTLYEDKIYNNGVITATGTGSNIGGLIGNNTGSLTAGYNTGAINAESSTNVGGIVGNNEGTVDQVFNTVFNADGTLGTITGGSYVGGIIGSNSSAGKLTNAYNTTAVSGAAGSTGSIAGSNMGTVQYVYGNSKLIGTGSGTVQYGYETTNDAQWKNSSSYNGFAFSNGNYDSQTGIWKIYESYGQPLLKVFLTSASYDSDADRTLPYTGKDQGLSMQHITAADGLQAYYQANSLLEALLNKDIGTDYLGFGSHQIAASYDGGFNPNNLGYDIDITYSIADILPWPGNDSRYNYLYKDYPFDRNRNFRERKAEINYENGGMEL